MPQKGEEQEQAKIVPRKTRSSKEGSVANNSSTKPTSEVGTEFRTESGTKILSPRGIAIKFGDLIRPEAHFWVSKPKGLRSKYYTEERHATPSCLWLEPDDRTLETIMAVYKCYDTDNVVEAEHATHWREVLFEMDPLAVVPARAREWRARRMVEVVAKASDSVFWSIPPLVMKADEASTLGTYELDIRPDCLYWLSVQAFQQAYVSMVWVWCFVLKKRMICPYMSIELMKDDQSLDAAEIQVAAAGCLALYNRFLLRKNSIDKTNVPWTEEHLKNIKQYGVTMGGGCYWIWCITPLVDESFQWANCEMTQVWKGDCSAQICDIRNLYDWINEIDC